MFGRQHLQFSLGASRANKANHFAGVTSSSTCSTASNSLSTDEEVKEAVDTVVARLSFQSVNGDMGETVEEQTDSKKRGQAERQPSETDRDARSDEREVSPEDGQKDWMIHLEPTLSSVSALSEFTMSSEGKAKTSKNNLPIIAEGAERSGELVEGNEASKDKLKEATNASPAATDDIVALIMADPVLAEIIDCSVELSTLAEEDAYEVAIEEEGTYPLSDHRQNVTQRIIHAILRDETVMQLLRGRNLNCTPTSQGHENECIEGQALQSAPLEPNKSRGEEESASVPTSLRSEFLCSQTHDSQISDLGDSDSVLYMEYDVLASGIRAVIEVGSDIIPSGEQHEESDKENDGVRRTNHVCDSKSSLSVMNCDRLQSGGHISTATTHVQFAQSLVSEVRERPRTEADEIRGLFYSSSDIERFEDEADESWSCLSRSWSGSYTVTPTGSYEEELAGSRGETPAPSPTNAKESAGPDLSFFENMNIGDFINKTIGGASLG